MNVVSFHGKQKPTSYERKNTATYWDFCLFAEVSECVTCSPLSPRLHLKLFCLGSVSNLGQEDTLRRVHNVSIVSSCRCTGRPRKKSLKNPLLN